MRSSRGRALAFPIVALSALALPASAEPGLFGRIRDRIRDRVDARIENLRREIELVKDFLPDRPCAKEFRDLTKQALDARRQCLEDPPAGSPIDRFERLSRKDADDFCGKRSDAECLDLVLDQQEAFCRQRTAGLVAKAVDKRVDCTKENAKRFAGNVKSRVKAGVEKRIEMLRGILDTLGTLQRPCAAAFRNDLKGVLETRRRCLSDAPPGSPIARFEGFSRQEEDAFCGSRGDSDCLDLLLDEQERFCNQRGEAEVKKLLDARADCAKEGARRFVGSLDDRLRGVVARHVDAFRQSLGILEEALRGRPCAKEFQAAVEAAVDAHRDCLTSALPGSPLERFRKMSRAEEDAFCGTRSDTDCLAFLADEQQKFCRSRTEALARAAIEKRRSCR